MKRRHQKRKTIRSESGVLGMILFLAVVTITLGVASFAYDISHNILVRSQLQSAADAAALAGAYDLCFSGGSGAVTTSAAAASSYSATAALDATALAEANNADGSAITASQITVSPCQYSSTGNTPPNGYSSSFYMTVNVQKKVVNLFASLYGHTYDTISATAVAGPIGAAGGATTVTTPYPLALYSGNASTGAHSWVIEAGTNTLSVGILPLLTNGSTTQFVSGPTGLLGGVLATAGAGGNAYPTLQMLQYFDPSQTNTIAPPAQSVGQTIMLLNPGVTGLNLSLTKAGPLTVENYMQTGSYGSSLLGLINTGPSYAPGLASFLANKTYMVPVVTNPTTSILSMPLASILQGGVASQITGFVPVTFTSTNAQLLTGITLLGVVVLPSNYIINGTVLAGTNSSTALPANVGLVN